MGLRFENLDEVSRPLMLEEIERDQAAGVLDLSNYLNEAGCEQWPRHLKDAAAKGTDDAFAQAMREGQCFKLKVERRKPTGGYTMVTVPVTAAQTLAEAQFNMYYMRALARRAIDENKALEVYRAKRVENPRPDSEAMIGQALDPALVLNVLRNTRGVEPSIGIPLPNSGLTVRLV